MKGIRYQLKSVLRDKLCLMTFLLPIVVAAVLSFMGSIDMSSLGELHFGALHNDLSHRTVAWLERYGPVSFYETSQGIMLPLILLSSFVAALIGLFIGRLSDGLMTGVIYIKIVMLLFIAVPILCALTGISGPLAAICYLMPSWPAFEGIMALSGESVRTAVKDIGILTVHCIAWFALYILISARHKKQPIR